MNIYAVVAHCDDPQARDCPQPQFFDAWAPAEQRLRQATECMEEAGHTGTIEIRELKVADRLAPEFLIRHGHGVLLCLPHRVMRRYSVGGCGVVKLES